MFDKETRPVPNEPGISRRDTSSTTGSGRPPPPGHWTFSISGNCPRCHHHHRSLRVHVRSTENTSGLDDVRCERCDKLWIGPGSLNATRISLASNETIDPTPKDPVARTALTEALRSVTRVATLSPTLPDIQEGLVGFSSESQIPSPAHRRNRDSIRHSVNQTPYAAPGFQSGSRRLSHTGPSAKRFDRTNTDVIYTARPQRILSMMKRRLEASRLGRMPLVTKFLHEEDLTTSSNRDHSHDTSATPIVQSTLPGSTPLPVDVAVQGANPPPAQALEAPSQPYDWTEESIQLLSPEERFAYLRAQITASRSERLETQLRTSSQIDQTIQDLVAGMGQDFDQTFYRGFAQDNQYTHPRSSLQISEARTSEADTAVDGRIFAPDDFVREMLHRAYRLSVESSQAQDQRDGTIIRSSSDSTVTAGIIRTANERHTTSDHLSE